MAASQQPVYQAYTVIKRDGADDYWLSIGAAFSHQDGNGLNLILQAMPLNGKIVLRPPKDKDADSTQKPSEPSSQRRRENNRR